MRKADIKEGVTYRTKNGSAARRVMRFASSPGHTCLVEYEQMRGPGKGKSGILSLDSFAAWAHSEDGGAPAGASDLREENERLREALKPFAALSAMDPHRKGIICGIDHTDIRWEHMHRAAELVG